MCSELSWQMITSQEELLVFLNKHAQAESCFVDLEADNMHHYGERICLIQLLVREEIVLIDPLAEELEPDLFYAWLEKREVWMHGADYDMRLFLSVGATLPEPLWDTQIAAQLLGREKFGLAALVKEEFDVSLSKSSQRADWSKRPLPKGMQEYAASDVFYLPELSRRYLKELRKRGRYEWFVQSCERSRAQGMERGESDPEMIWRIGGWGKLSRRALAYLRELWHWREEAARSWDKPVFYLANNQKLLDWAGQLERGETPNFERVRSRWKGALHEAIERASKLKAEQLPQRRLGEKRGKRKPDWEAKVEQLRQWRNKRAKQVGIDAGVIASRASLEALVSHPERAQEYLMNWQLELLQIESAEKLAKRLG